MTWQRSNLWLLGLGIVASLFAVAQANEKSISGSLKASCAGGSFPVSCGGDGNACFDSENITCCGCKAKDCWGCESLGCPLTPFGNCTAATLTPPERRLKMVLPAVIVMGIISIIGILVGFFLYLRNSRSQQSRWWSKGVNDSDLPSLTDDDSDLPSVALLPPSTLRETNGSTLRVTDHVLLDPWSKQYDQNSPLFRNSYQANPRPTELMPRGTKGGPKAYQATSSSRPSSVKMSINEVQEDEVIEIQQ